MIIAFSSCSYSGKSTTIDKIKKILGDRCFIVGELIREVLRKEGIESIDEVRKDTNKYFDLQVKIIHTKINQESAYKAICTSNEIVLIDRSLADSYYYFKTYINFEKLTESKQAAYKEFEEYFLEKAKIHYQTIYDKIIIFSPIDCSKNNDKMRPADLVEKQIKEYNSILELNYNFSYMANVRRKIIGPVNVIHDMDIILKECTISN